jgi:hypothetical protein
MHSDRRAERHAKKQTGRQTGRQTNSQGDRGTQGHKDARTHRHTCTRAKDNKAQGQLRAQWHKGTKGLNCTRTQGGHNEHKGITAQRHIGARA